MMLNCNNNIIQSDGSKKIIAFKATKIYPRLTDKMELLGYDTVSTYMYIINNQTYLQSGYTYTESDSTGIIAKNIRYSHILFSNKSNKAILKDTFRFKNPLIVNKDSILKNEWVQSFDVTDIFHQSFSNLLKSQVDKNGLKETYFIQRKRDTTLKGCIEISFVKAKFDTTYSLSRALEKQKKMRLRSVRIINYSRKIPPINLYVPDIFQGYDLEEIDVDNKNQVDEMFQLYKNLIKE